MLERLGIFEEHQERRVTYARFIAPPDRVASKSHTITVDLKAETRTVEHQTPARQPQVKPKPIRPTPEENAAAMRARIANLCHQVQVLKRENEALAVQIEPRGPLPTIAGVQQAFADFLASAGYQIDGRPYGITDLRARVRAPSYSHPRHVCIDLVRRLCGASSSLIGKYFGGLDHTSVLNALKRAPAHMERESLLSVIHARTLAAFEVKK